MSATPERAPTVSIVVACYNYGRYVKQCVESILAQRFSDLELIVIDDASTDDSLAVLERFDDPRLRILRHEQNRGHIASFNEGFAAARGRYINHIGADDYCHPDFLARTVAVLDARPDLMLVRSNAAVVDHAGNITNERADLNSVDDGVGGSDLPRLLYDDFYVAGSAVFRRECLDLIGGGFDPRYPLGEDWRFWLTINKRHRVRFLDEPLVYYRMHGGNLHGQLKRVSAGEDSERGILDEFFADPTIDPSIVAQKNAVLASAYLRFANGYFWSGAMGEARRCLRTAARLDPATMKRTRFWKRVMSTFVPPKMYRAMSGVKRAIGAPRGA